MNSIDKEGASAAGEQEISFRGKALLDSFPKDACKVYLHTFSIKSTKCR